MPVQSIPQFPFLKGVVASNQPLAEPKGAVDRISNLLMASRGAADPCDGSGILFDYQGAVQNNRGKITANFLFQPIGVPNYYLSIQKVPDLPLGPPQNLVTADGGAGGTLPTSTTLFYKVTALDGAGGETTVSNEASFVEGATAHKVILTWNVVPNATGYNIYRGTSSGTELKLVGTGLPVPQVPTGTLTVTFTDDGTDSVPTYTISTGSCYAAGAGISSATFIVNTTAGLIVGQSFLVSGTTNVKFDGGWIIQGIVNSTQITATKSGLNLPSHGQTTSGGTAASGVAIPIFDTTQQTALFKMPLIVGSPAILPVPYDESNIVALYPADNLPNPDGGGGGGSGGGGGGGGGGTGGGGGGGGGTSTPSGGIEGNVTLIPQFRQFTNRAVIALGNGYPPQLFSDPSTAVNPATVATIPAISVDPFGVVTVTTSVPHGIQPTQVGGNVVISGVTNVLYNGTFPVINVISPTQYQVRNLAAIGQPPSSQGSSTTTSLPIFNSFIPAYPVWAATSVLQPGDVLVPVTQPSPAIYLTVVQGGTTGAAEPTWPTGGLASVGQTVKDGTVIYKVAGLLNSAAPAPPGAAHIEVYSGALWVWDTSPNNTSNGLDGPCSLRMSNINNPNSWNPVNQAFIDRDDGSEGMGLAKFTITALGIPPEGSLVVFKNYQGYQVLGVFGASNFAIQAISSDLGCTAPRTIQFVPGFGIMRYTHLGYAIFNGVKDEIVSEQIRPYLFPSDDQQFADITVLDANWVSVSWGSQTATPPMYIGAMPIGPSGGQLTRIFCYDLIFKAWVIVDLPFAIATVSQFRTVSANPVTVFGGFLDGTLQRWQAGDILWYTGSNAPPLPSQVQWSFNTMTVASNTNDQRVYNRRLVLTAINSTLSGTISVTWRRDRIVLGTRTFLVSGTRNFDIDVATGFTGKQFDAIISGNCDPEINGLTWEVEARPAGVVVAI